MKVLKLDIQIILDYYTKEIRPLTEHGVIVWNSGLNAGQIKQLVKIQKLACLIILGYKVSYSEAGQKLCLKTQQERRNDLCTSFAIKLFKSDRKHEFFKFPSLNTKMNHSLVIEPLARTKRAQTAPHIYLSRLINENMSKLD